MSGQDEEAVELGQEPSTMCPSPSPRSYALPLLASVAGMVIAVFLLSSTGIVSNQGNAVTMLASSKPASIKETSGRVYYSALKASEKKSLFEDFMMQYSKSYASDDEKDERYANFKKFLKKSDKRNKKEEEKGENTAVHGVTQFADLSEDEISDYLLGYKKPSSKDARRQLKVKSGVAKVEKYTGNETNVNWAGVYTTSVNNQGYCGSCWAFSTAEQLESDSIRAGYLTTDDKLSVQQLVSCDTVDFGCEGGNTETAYEYINGAGGIMLEADYPYTSFLDFESTCKSSSSSFAVTVDKYYTLESEDDMISYVQSKGPLSICAAASSWVSYKSGVVSVCDDEVDHCIQITGIDTEDNYWIIRNSWGTSWGYDGYIYVKSGENMCAITTDPTYADITKLN